MAGWSFGVCVGNQAPDEYVMAIDLPGITERGTLGPVEALSSSVTNARELRLELVTPVVLQRHSQKDAVFCFPCVCCACICVCMCGYRCVYGPSCLWIPGITV